MKQKPPFEPEDPDFQRDPYPVFAELRRRPVFFHEPWQQWIVTRYADVDRILRDRRFGRVLPEQEAALPQLPSFTRIQSRSLMELEPPDHTQLRRLVQGVFTPKHVRQLEAGIAAHVDELLDDLDARPERRADLLEDFAQPIPIRVIADLLGIPGSDRHRLAGWSQDIIALFEPAPSEAAQRAGERAAAEFSECIERCVEVKTSEPEDDLLSRLAALHREDPNVPTLDEIVSNAILLLNAGHEAVANVIGNGLRALCLHPDERRRLERDPGLGASAVEEMMRWDTPVPLFDRFALEDAEVGGHTYRRGDGIAVYLGSANRDPEVFDDAERFDVGRSPNPHVAFGLGTHFCLGAPLGRLELNVILPRLLARWPALQLDDERPARFRPANVFHVLDGLWCRY
ncbi:MAG: cytochrome P450 [Acidobacteriota bacterium]